MILICWLLVITAGLMGWYTGMLIHKLDEWLCPARYVVSAMCYAPWSAFVQYSAFVIGSATAACLVVLLPALTAPSRRRAVAWTVFFVGMAVAIDLLSRLGTLAGVGVTRVYWLPAATAVLAGAVTLWFLDRARANGNAP